MLIRGLKESSLGSRKCKSKGKDGAGAGSLPFLCCTSPFLGCEEQQGSDSKAFICKITANKSNSNNTLPPIACSLVGGGLRRGESPTIRNTDAVLLPEAFCEASSPFCAIFTPALSTMF